MIQKRISLLSGGKELRCELEINISCVEPLKFRGCCYYSITWNILIDMIHVLHINARSH